MLFAFVQTCPLVFIFFFLYQALDRLFVQTHRLSIWPRTLAGIATFIAGSSNEMKNFGRAIRKQLIERLQPFDPGHQLCAILTDDDKRDIEKANSQVQKVFHVTV